MAFGSVFVKGPQNRDVFINGFFLTPQGKTNDFFVVNMGQTTFATVDAQNQIDFAGTANVSAANPNVQIVLKALNPPQALPGHQVSARAMMALGAMPKPKRAAPKSKKASKPARPKSDVRKPSKSAEA
ncbi:hypothetical protein FFK22_039765 [Mycobacterium sp. KBS0706]|uniref:hypothetical protein n=1 Tax=Mycobacterium sp. KBS0706 TaxID=2578109 RepID=UPI00110F9F89|nr:hypothetical protein [Mycobacterium sp. KBS0706]TSD83048.1 hypothetical protein FFK22_039765 [Mycobacterium sp. KBS0706]